MPDRCAARSLSRTCARAALLLLCAATIGLATAAPASADTVVIAYPAQAPADEEGIPCAITDPLCVLGQAAGAAVTDVWTNAMLSLWGAGLWLLGLAFTVIDALATPDLSAGGPLAGVYPVTFGIGAAVAVLMALVQAGVAAVRRDGQTLGRLLIGVVQFGLVWAGYVGVAALLVTGVSGLTTALLQSLLGIDKLAAFDPSIDVGRDLVGGAVATVLGVSAVFLLLPASLGYLLLMLVREAALLLLAATSAISAGGLLAQTSSAWFWRSLRWFVAALLVAPVAVLVLGIGVTITEGILTGAPQTGTASAVGTAVVGCLLILIGAVCPLVLFRLLAFVDPGTSSGAAFRQSVAASGGILGAVQRLGGGGGQAAAIAAAASSGGAAASGAAARSAAGRSQGESTADAATSGRFSGALRGLAAGTSTAGRLAAGVAASATDVLSSAGVGHSTPYYGQASASASSGTTRGGGAAVGTDHGRQSTGLGGVDAASYGPLTHRPASTDFLDRPAPRDDGPATDGPFEPQSPDSPGVDGGPR